eukprot:scaffold29317_cov101-Isochrysis_galbana.AAC.1
MQHVLAMSHWYVSGYGLSFKHPVRSPPVLPAKPSPSLATNAGLVHSALPSFTPALFTACGCLSTAPASSARGGLPCRPKPSFPWPSHTMAIVHSHPHYSQLA